jgi:hypothetical protein
MSMVVRVIAGAALTVVGAVTGNWQLAIAGVSMIGGALLQPKVGNKKRAASSSQVQIGETAREALVGTGSTAGSLVDAFNYGGKYGTDWEVLVLDLFDHRCHSLVGFYVNDTYVAFTGDGMVPGYNNQLQVYWRPGTENQTVPAILTANSDWTANDNGAGICHVTVAYKADDPEAKNPVWPGGRPRFQWIVKGALCYDARKDSSVGGFGAHRIDQPATWEYSDNPIVARYKWVRGFYACDRVGDPSQLLIGRGLTAVEAPPANVFGRANLCDEVVDGEKRYRVGGSISAAETFLAVEEDFAAACAGTIVQPEGCVEIDPGEARAIVATFTDRDLVVGSRVRWNNGMLSSSSDEWVNTIVASYVEPDQKWAEHAAPVLRDPADLVADRQPREQRLMLGFVQWMKQALRVGEVNRRLGRLRGRAEVTLPPRFANIEEGDWVQWQSDRRFKGATMTFRVEAWGSDEKWHHSLKLRQISASVFSDTAPLDDGSIAAQHPAPPPIGAPGAGSWAVAAGHLEAGGLLVPALIVTGARDDNNARFIRMEYVQGAGEPGPLTQWSDAGITGPDVKRREIVVAPKGIYRVAISYVVNGVQGDRLILGPVTAGATTYPDGTPVEDLQPAEPGATDGATVGDGDNPGNVKDQNGVVRPASDLLNNSLALNPDGSLVIIREGEASTPLGQVRAAAIGAASDSAMRSSRDALERLSAIVTMIDTRLASTQAVIRDAGIYVDPTNGLVTISALDATEERVNDVSVQLDAVKGDILLRATTTYVDNAIAQAVIDPSQIPVFDQLELRITTAEARLDGAEAAIELKADAVTLTALTATVTTVSADLDALAGVVATKVDSVDFGTLETRVANAEDSLTALGDTAEIGRGISVARMTGRQVDDEAALSLAGLLAGDARQRNTIAALALAREEITARLIEGDGAEASARFVLTARVASAEGAITNEQAVRAGETGALAAQMGTISTTVGTHSAAIETFGESINGLSLRYGLRLNAGGRVIGWVANNDGVNGGMDFVVDYFRLWDADGTTSKAPFEFVDGSIFMTSAAIKNLSVDTIKIANNAITFPVHMDAASVFLNPASGEQTLLESAWLELGTIANPATALVGFYATLRTDPGAGGGPDNAAEFKVYCDIGAGYQLMGAQAVGIEATGGNVYYWVPVSVIDLASNLSTARFKVTGTPIAGPQGRPARRSLVGAPTLVIQGSKR